MRHSWVIKLNRGGEGEGEEVGRGGGHEAGEMGGGGEGGEGDEVGGGGGVACIQLSWCRGVGERQLLCISSSQVMLP